jgi:RNA polymerase sigma-54 factor
MAVTQRLELRQGQSLVMTPQLQQAIKLLQLSHLDLAAYVERELEQNPLLERDESDVDTGDGEASAEEASQRCEKDDAEPADSLDPTTAEPLPPRDQAPLDTDYANESTNDATDDWPGDWPGDWPSDGAGGGGFQNFGKSSGRIGDTGGDAGGEQRLSSEQSLRDLLLEQLQMDLNDPTDRIIGLHLIDQLDEAGYLVADFPALAEMLGCKEARLEATLERLQRFEPSGVFARNLRECLALQLADRDRLDPAMSQLIENLDLLARRDFAALKRRCHVDDEDLADMIAEIRALDPKPALAFDHKMAEPVVPDVFVRRRARGDWVLELNSDTLPRVLVNHRYYSRVNAKAHGQEARGYLSERFQSANWLIKALHQRATTILKVTEEIVRQQENFLERGVQFLRPMTLRQIAEAIEMHESTVSRVTANKYMSTPRGICELKYFFTSSISGVSDGVTHSAEAVRQRIKDLVDGETAASVLSDDGLVERLREEGIDIARRTVAKYREAMRIPSSVQRRRDKAAGL